MRYLGLELGSTRIKSCAINSEGEIVATGVHEWENQLVNGHWSYSLEQIWEGVQHSYSDLCRNLGEYPETWAAIGLSAMMHGYLAFNRDGVLLTPFRTWRDTTTGSAARKLSQLFGVNVPLRWSIAHHYQAILDQENHVRNLDFLTTLAGYVHWQLTGSKVLGIGDAVGMFPIDSDSLDYDSQKLNQYQNLTGIDMRKHLPRVLVAGEEAGTLSREGAKLLDPTGHLQPGIPLCPPEGDAGTGMVATNSINPRTGNVSVGTSIFAMVVLEKSLTSSHPELDPVATPDGHPVAMVHCNNGTNELNAWMGVFAEAVNLVSGKPKVSTDTLYSVLFQETLKADTDGGGLTTCNYLSGEPIVRLSKGHPLIIREVDSRLNLGNFLRSQVFTVFATLALGMKILHEEGVKIDSLAAHGGFFRTAEVGQRLLAAALDTPISIAESAGEGGAWGAALLARSLHTEGSLSEYLATEIFNQEKQNVSQPRQEDKEGFEDFLARFVAALEIQPEIIRAMSDTTATGNM
ncbi:ATPase [Corynebacterium poyangense]|uniref:ATPase n=1 Tax=Corynebacterium poyangense TaxID=2684405 RepID=A0A7H0SQH6_9CORY|nr:FGGY-family carbohydrate kinase [Corynebacterium poyangense]QNQ90801.1 ATPase [Corynebacterium poyangense]